MEVAMTTEVSTSNEVSMQAIEEQLAELKTDEGIWLDVEVIYTQATRKN